MSHNEISQEEKQSLQEAIIDELTRSNSQNELANKLKISAATLVNIKTGKWERISPEMFLTVQAYFRNDTKWTKFTTWNTDAITKVCDDARINKRFMAIAGYTGAGKTTALKLYEKSHTQVYYVLATTVMNKKTFLLEVQRAMGISEGASIQDLMDGIITKLQKTAQPLLIIDDAGKLNASILPFIQVIYDATEFNAGIVLSGTEYLRKLLTTGVKKNSLGFRELYRRISYWQPMKPPSLKKVAEICELNAIRDPQAVKYIHEHSLNYGDIRNWITNAKKAHKEKKVPIDRAMLDSLNVGSDHYNFSAA